MKQQLQRVVLALLLAMSGIGALKAQLPVTDVGNMIQQAASAADQLAQLVKQFNHETQAVQKLFESGQEFYTVSRDFSRSIRTFRLIGKDIQSAQSLLNKASYLTPSERLMIINRYASILEEAKDELTVFKEFNNKTKIGGRARATFIEQIEFLNKAIQRLGYIGLKVTNTTKMWQRMNNDRHHARMEQWRINALIGAN